MGATTLRLAAGRCGVRLAVATVAGLGSDVKGLRRQAPDDC